MNLEEPKHTGDNVNKRSYAVELPESPGPSHSLLDKFKEPTPHDATTSQHRQPNPRESKDRGL